MVDNQSVEYGIPPDTMRQSKLQLIESRITFFEA